MPRAKDDSMDLFLDTQIVSKAFKDVPTPFQKGASICSIVASEFLLVQHPTPTKANYYIRRHRHWAGVLGAAANDDALAGIDHPAPKRSTDALLMDFGGQFPSIIEFNSLSLSFAINNARIRSFTSAVRFLPQDTAKLLVRRFKFILGAGLVCVPLGIHDVQLGFALLKKFIGSHEPKKNFRNTWNDILILSCAVNRAATLITEDNLLSRFAADLYGAKHQLKDAFLSLSFPKIAAEKSVPNSESKGYINTPWKVYEARKRSINGT